MTIFFQIVKDFLKITYLMHLIYVVLLVNGIK